MRQPKPSDGTAAEPWVVAFETELGAPYFVKVRKTYTLAPEGLRLPAARWT